MCGVNSTRTNIMEDLHIFIGSYLAGLDPKLSTPNLFVQKLAQRPIYPMIQSRISKQRLLAEGSTEVLLPWIERNQWQNRSLTC
jgi:hypothetical protein